MSNIDKQALREAAEKALPAMQRLLMMPNDELFDEALLNVDGDVDAANAFNLLTGPETVLALLDELKFEHEQNVMASRALITQHVRANEAEARIAETENDKSRMVDAMHAAVALNSAGISLYDFDECVSRLHEWGALPDYCIALYVDFIHGFVSENKLLDFGYINDNGAFAARQAEKRIAELEAIAKSVKFHPIPMVDLGNRSDGKKHPYMFGAGYNSAVVHCESVLLQAFAAAAGKGGAS